MAQAAEERGDHVLLVAEEVHPVIVVETGGDGGAAPVARLQTPSRCCPSRKTHDGDGTVLPVTIPCLAPWGPRSHRFGTRQNRIPFCWRATVSLTHPGSIGPALYGPMVEM